MRKSRRILQQALKAALAAVILGWMVRSGRLDLTQLSQAAHQWPYLLAIGGICYTGFLLTAMRWRLLLASQGVPLSLWKSFSLTMIGVLFSTVIPGTVSGDVVKAYYIRASVPERSARAITTILVDRIVGMLGLLVLSAVGGLFSYNVISGNRQVRLFYWMVAAAALCFAAGIAIAVVSSRWAVNLADRMAGRFRVLSAVKECLGTLAVFHAKPLVLVAALAISLPGQALTSVAFYLAARALGISSLPFLPFLWIVPLGLVAMSIPIAPAGLGIGQMAFYTLFEFVFPGNGNLGSSMSVVFHLAYIAASLSGIVFYLTQPARAAATTAPSPEGTSPIRPKTAGVRRVSTDSMCSPLVTVVTPSFNQGRFIRATIESVLGQDYPKIEYIVMDGGSTDETASVVKDYASRLTFISEKDRGQSHAINKGFQRANGAILAWLNSDDLFLPGAVSRAVQVFREKPATGAVYGEGYLIDRDGKVTGRFPCTEPLNLWKLVYLSDYILQQTVFFRGDVIRELGYLDENLHYTMDWDILIEIARRWPLEYVPEYMGCLREYPEAKSSAGGARRAREITNLLRRHTGMWLPPGAIVYGLDTYHKIWCEKIASRTPSFLNPVSRRLQRCITIAAGLVIGRTIRHSQGLYSDGWASRTLHYMLPPGRGRLRIDGTLLDQTPSLRGQALAIECNGRTMGRFPVPAGKFSLEVEMPEETQGQVLNLKLRARRCVVPARFRFRGDRRRLAYLVEGIRWTEPMGADLESAVQQPDVRDWEGNPIGIDL